MLMHAPTLPTTALPSKGPLQRNSYKPFATSQAVKSQLSRKHRCRCSSSKTEATQSAMQPSKNPSAAAVNGRITSQGYIPGPAEDPPSYANIDSSPWNRAIMAIFRQKMVTALHEDSEAKGYDAIIDLTRKLNSKYKHPKQTQAETKKILKTLFPGWLPGAFSAMFSRPVPQTAAKLNAWVTAITCQWLMGPCQVNDVELPNGEIRPKQGVLVERCRYLEEAGCASICINSCKVPTQEFFHENMGLDLTMTPNYEDYSCQFSFGQTPSAQDQDDVFSIPCFKQCPSKKRHSSQDQCHGITVEQQVTGVS